VGVQSAGIATTQHVQALQFPAKKEVQVLLKTALASCPED
jgi:hypothetical protein